MSADKQNPLGIPIAGWHTGDLRGFAIPTKGTAEALIEIYKSKSGGRDAESSVIWNRAESYIHFCSDRGPDIVSVLRRIGDGGILAVMLPNEPGDSVMLYIKNECVRRAWAVVRAVRGDDEEGAADAACDEPSEAEATDSEEED